MQIAIDPALDAADVVALLEEHVGEMRSISPPESTHALDLAALRAPDITFFTVRDDAGALLACAALRDLGENDPDAAGHLELKSMRTTALSRGRGIGAALLAHLLEHARGRGAARVSLETGAEDFFAPARSLYRRHGFVDCEPFGAYRPDPLSVFLTLPLGR